MVHVELSFDKHCCLTINHSQKRRSATREYWLLNYDEILLMHIISYHMYMIFKVILEYFRCSEEIAREHGDALFNGNYPIFSVPHSQYHNIDYVE